MLYYPIIEGIKTFIQLLLVLLHFGFPFLFIKLDSTILTIGKWKHKPVLNLYSLGETFLSEFYILLTNNILKILNIIGSIEYYISCKTSPYNLSSDRFVKLNSKIVLTGRFKTQTVHTIRIAKPQKLFSQIAVIDFPRIDAMSIEEFQVKLQIPSKKYSVRLKIILIGTYIHSKTVYDNLKVFASQLKGFQSFGPWVQSFSLSIKTYYLKWIKKSKRLFN